MAPSDMDEALNAHPDVAQNLVKLFSDALTESRGKVKELELSLSEKNAHLTEISTNAGNAESELIAKAQALAELQVLYSAEIESGFELLSALEERVLDLNSKEADVKEQLHLVAQERKSFARQKAAKISSASTLSSEGVGKERAVQLLHEKYDAAIGEKIALQKSLETTVSDMAALNQVVNEKFSSRRTPEAQADAQTAESLRSEAAEELQRQCVLKQELEIACIIYCHHLSILLTLKQALQESKSQLVSQTTLFTQAVVDNDIRFRALQTKLQNVESVAATGKQGHAKVVLEVVRCRANQTRLEEEISALADIRDADKAEILVLEDALKTRNVEFRGAPQQERASQACRNGHGVESEDVELVELREQIKSNAMDLKTALKARDAKLTGLQNENEQLKSTAKLLAAETSRHEQVEAATHLVKLTRQLKLGLITREICLGWSASQLKQVADEERRASEEKLNSALRANAMLQTAYLSLHKSHHQLVKERGAVEPSVNQAGTPAPAFPHAQSAAGSHSDRQNGRHEEQRVGAYTSSLPSPVWSESEADDRMSLNAEHAPGLSERALYNKFMARLPSPNRPIGFGALEPIHAVPQLDAFSHGLKTEWQGVHFPKRSFFTHLDCIHALVFAPIHEYWDPAEKRDTFSNTGKFCSQTFDLFMNRGSFVYYAGIYTMHTSEASMLPVPIFLRMWKMPDCFPDGKMKVKCYGLQFLGFDMGVYKQLRLRYLASTNEGMKRKASTADLHAGDGSAKMQRTQ
ncbi:hypothetical protein C8J57DRAFT_1534388 [Mycena rebaudengoi]|nr:hypothetical protein C8J57DRAFT_1534388 [Mycena rebaudengoi]